MKALTNKDKKMIQIINLIKRLNQNLNEVEINEMAIIAMEAIK